MTKLSHYPFLPISAKNFGLSPSFSQTNFTYIQFFNFLPSDTTEDKLSFIETRVEDLRCLAEPIISESGAAYNDKLRYFSGDHPEQQFEAGQSQGNPSILQIFPLPGSRREKRV